MHLEDYMLPCLNKKLFGFECMGCGLQRSLALLVNGDFVAAFLMYPAVYPLLALFGFLGLGIFVKIKFSNIITPVLAILTVITIITSYIIKLTI